MDQFCEQQSELTAFAGRGGYDIVGVFKETASGTSANRAARPRVGGGEIRHQIRRKMAIRPTRMPQNVWTRMAALFIAFITEAGVVPDAL
mgnify:CR=1 FL=1